MHLEEPMNDNAFWRRRVVVMKLVRYMSFKWGIEAVKSGLFKLLRPLGANDPYEMMGACTGKLRPEVKADMLDDMKYAWVKAGLPMSGKVANYPISEVIARVENNHYFFQMMLMSREVQQEANAMLCFVDADQIDAVTDQLMWGHYTKGGTGIRIWFESGRFPDELPPLFKVKYLAKRPCIDLGTLNAYNDINVWGRFLFDILITKSNAWAYEHEYRMMIPPMQAGSFVVNKDDLEFVRIGPECISRIDLGPMGVQEDSGSIIEELKSNPATAHIDFRLATFKSEEYAYDYIRFEDFPK